MEKQASMRQNSMRQSSKHSIAAVSSPSFAASRRDGSLSLATDDRKRIPEGGETTNPVPITFDEPPSHSIATTGTKFDKLEALGPSLLEVLTLIHPPQPQSQRQQQDAGEDAGGDNNTGLEELGDVADINVNAKFDVCLSRSAILAKLVNPSNDNTRKLQEFFAKTLEVLKCEATGVILIQDTTVVMFFETTADEFLKICAQIKSLDQVLDISSTKVLASCDDNPVRVLQGLYFRKISITRASSDAGEWTDDTLRQVSVDTFINLVKFAKRIGPLPPAEIRKALTTLSNSDQMLIPSNDLVLWLIGREDVMDIDEFLTLFASPIAIELESERVWPVHPLLSY